MRPIRATRDFKCSSSSAKWLHCITYDFPVKESKNIDLAKHLIERHTQPRKAVGKKIQELLDREGERDQLYYDYLKTNKIRR